MCELEDVCDCADARSTRSGAYSAWLKKSKGDAARAKWLVGDKNTRYFTIDFDAQLFYYSHSKDNKKISSPYSFRDILGAERLPAPAKAAKKGGRAQSSGFMVRTKGKTFELHTEGNGDAAQWVFALNAARDLGLVSPAPSVQLPMEVTPTSPVSMAEVPSSMAARECQRENSEASLPEPAPLVLPALAVAAERPPMPPAAAVADVRASGQGSPTGLRAPLAAEVPMELAPREAPTEPAVPAAATAIAVTTAPLPAEAPRALVAPAALAAPAPAETPAAPAAPPPAEAPVPVESEPAQPAPAVPAPATPAPPPPARVVAAPPLALVPAASEPAQPAQALPVPAAPAPPVVAPPSPAHVVTVPVAVASEPAQPAPALPAPAAPVPSAAAPPSPARVVKAICPPPPRKKLPPVVLKGSPRLPASPDVQPAPAAVPEVQPLAASAAPEPPAAPLPPAVPQAPELCEWDEPEAPKAAVPERGLAADAEACEWDEEAKCIDSKKESGAKASADLPLGGPVGEAEPSGWDSEPEEACPERRAARAVVRTSPQLSHAAPPAPSMPVPAVAAEVEGETKHGIAMSFDMGQPRKAIPKHLADRLSRPASSKRRREKEAPVGAEPSVEQQPVGSGIEASEGSASAAPQPSSAARRTSAPKRLAPVLAPVRAPLRAPAPVPPAAGAVAEVAAPQPPAPPALSEDVACGAPPKPAAAFVAAPPAPAAPVPPAAADLLAEVLGSDDFAAAPVPFRSSGSHGFVDGFHCVGCDMQVLKIDGYIWAETTPYIFLRNNYPNVMKLRGNLRSQPSSSAYCCQCSSRSADKAAGLELVAEGLRWRVIGER